MLCKEYPKAEKRAPLFAEIEANMFQNLYGMSFSPELLEQVLAAMVSGCQPTIEIIVQSYSGGEISVSDEGGVIVKPLEFNSMRNLIQSKVAKSSNNNPCAATLEGLNKVFNK
jgi:hypothetical protein